MCPSNTEKDFGVWVLFGCSRLNPASPEIQKIERNGKTGHRSLLPPAIVREKGKPDLDRDHHKIALNHQSAKDRTVTRGTDFDDSLACYVNC